MIARRVKRITIIIIMIIVSSVLGMSIWHKVNPKGFFNTFGFRNYLIAYTGSMEPRLKQNDLIIVEKYSFDKLKVGDIITFMGKTNDGKKIPITHQIVQIVVEESGNKFLRTKGINLSKPDLIPVTKDGAEGSNVYIGRLKASSRIVGNIFAFVGSPMGLFTLTVNLVCFAGIMIVLKRINTVKY